MLGEPRRPCHGKTIADLIRNARFRPLSAAHQPGVPAMLARQEMHQQR